MSEPMPIGEPLADCKYIKKVFLIEIMTSRKKTTYQQTTLAATRSSNNAIRVVWIFTNTMHKIVAFPP